MNPQAHLLQHFLGVEVLALLVVGVVFLLAQLVEVREDRKITGLFCGVVRAVRDAEPGVQFHEEYLYGIDLRVGKILVSPEKVLEKRNVL